MSKVHPDASADGSEDGDDDGDDDLISLPSVSSESENSDDDSEASEAAEDAEPDKKTWGDQRTNAAAAEKAAMVQAWRKVRSFVLSRNRPPRAATKDPL